MQNPMCDGSGPCHPFSAEVRVLPLSSNPHNGNIIYCEWCFRREIFWRKERNRELAKDCQFDLPTWESLEIYGKAVAS